MPAMATPPAARDQLLANAGLAVMVLLGGGFFPVIERTLETWDSPSATAARQTIGAGRRRRHPGRRALLAARRPRADAGGPPGRRARERQ